MPKEVSLPQLLWDLDLARLTVEDHAILLNMHRVQLGTQKEWEQLCFCKCPAFIGEEIGLVPNA